MLILLSPSKTQDFTEYKLPEGVQPSPPSFLDEINQLAKTLKSYTPDQIKSLMSVSEKIADLNFTRFQDFSSEFHNQNSKPAFLAFKGDVYKHIDSDIYTVEDWQFANQHCFTISGLYGLLKPLDLIQPYRLEMKTKLPVAKGKDLYQFWGNKLANSLNQSNQPFILNLASHEYSKAVLNKEINKKVYNIIFKDFKSGKHKIIALYAKLARGSIANHIIKNKITSIQKVKESHVDGYKFSPENSTETDLVFLRG